MCSTMIWTGLIRANPITGWAGLSHRENHGHQSLFRRIDSPIPPSICISVHEFDLEMVVIVAFIQYFIPYMCFSLVGLGEKDFLHFSFAD